MGGEHSAVRASTGSVAERGPDLAAGLAADDRVVGRRLCPAVDQASQASRHDRPPPSTVDHEVRRDPVEPGPRLVGHPTAADLLGQPEERLGQDVLRRARIALDAADEGGEFAVVRVVDGQDDAG